jgi:AbiU2
MAYEQQIAKLKGHARAFVDELEWIIQCFELVQPTINDQDLIKAFSRNKRTLGFRIARRCVGRYCILGITRVTYDHGPKNPTAGKLIAAITCPGADRLREQLKAAFARPVRPGEILGRPPSELDRAASEEIDKNEIAKGRETFDDHISQLKEQWQWFSEHEPKFVDFRNKYVAHLEVSKSGEEYGPTEIGPLKWGLAVQAVRRLIKVAQLLSAILGNESRDFDQFESFAQTDARHFWQE